LFTACHSNENVGQNAILTTQDTILRYKFSFIVVRSARVVCHENKGGLLYSHYSMSGGEREGSWKPL
jgi:hypothetical protein